jgi:hypothetical protein
MALRGITPKLVEKRAKLFLFGGPGVGKTTCAIQFPSPYLIDTERGAENDEYVAKLQAAGGAYFFTADFDELLREVTTLLTEKHGYRTLILDPLTVVYNDLLDRCARELAEKDKTGQSDGTEFGRHKALADRKVKRLVNLLLRLDMNVVITSHSKTRWEKVGSEFKDAGTTFDCYAKLDYIFDLVFELQKRGSERVVVVRKTRMGAFPEGDVFPASYDAIAERYGRAILERGAVAVELATAEQVAEIQRLVDLLKIESSVTDKWLAKADADNFDEFPRDVAEKIIASLIAKVTNTQPADAA